MILTCDRAGPAPGEVKELFDSEINVKIKGNGSGRGRPLYTIIMRRVFRSVFAERRDPLYYFVFYIFYFGFAVEENHYWFCTPPHFR